MTLDEAINDALIKNPDWLVDYKNGQTGKIGAFMGHVMKHSEEAIKDPRRADHRIRQRLEEEIKASQEKNE